MKDPTRLIGAVVEPAAYKRDDDPHVIGHALVVLTRGMITHLAAEFDEPRTDVVAFLGYFLRSAAKNLAASAFAS